MARRRRRARMQRARVFCAGGTCGTVVVKEEYQTTQNKTKSSCYKIFGFVFGTFCVLDKCLRNAGKSRRLREKSVKQYSGQDDFVKKGQK